MAAMFTAQIAVVNRFTATPRIYGTRETIWTYRTHTTRRGEVDMTDRKRYTFEEVDGGGDARLATELCGESDTHGRGETDAAAIARYAAAFDDNIEAVAVDEEVADGA